MSLLWPGFLLLLGLVPLVIGVYIWMLRRRRVALRYSSLALVRAALPR
jgi:Ca-activated chloride channel family protein